MEAELNSGIYTIPDVSKILQLPSPKVRRWIKEYWDTQFSSFNSTHYSWGSGRYKAVNFYTLIEFFIFYQLRNCGLSCRKIIKAHQIIAKDLKTNYPFASTSLLAGEKDIFYYYDKDTIVKADEIAQIGIKKMIEDYCKKIEFDSNNLAERYWPLGKKHSIVVDPQHQFGRPIIKGTNILVETLYNYLKGGETIDFIASLFEITKKDVRDAIAFSKRVA